MAKSRPVAPRWSPSTPPAEETLWRWALEQLPDDVLVLPQVAMTVGRGGRPQEAEADLVIVDPSFGVVVVEVKGGTLWYNGERAVWRRRESRGGFVRDPVQQAKRARSILRNALRDAGVSTRELALRWAEPPPSQMYMMQHIPDGWQLRVRRHRDAAPPAKKGTSAEGAVSRWTPSAA